MSVQANDCGHEAIVTGLDLRAVPDGANESWRYLSREYAKEG